MRRSPSTFEELMARLVNWAEAHPDIRAVVVVGSRARIDHPADMWADLDIILVTTDKDYYLSTADWMRSIGNPVLTFLEPTATGNEIERRVLFEGMLDVDFSIVPKEVVHKLIRAEISNESAREIADTLGRGMRVLIDKDNVAEQFRALTSYVKARASSQPTRREFLEVVNDFLYHAVFITKHLRRGELWWAGTCCNCYMQRLLLQMIEWHAQANHGWSYDTWFRGRFLEEWADPAVLEGLRETFARYDRQDLSRALLATLNMFRQVALETANRLGYEYPVDVDEQVSKWVRNCLLPSDESIPKSDADSCCDSETPTQQ